MYSLSNMSSCMYSSLISNFPLFRTMETNYFTSLDKNVCKITFVTLDRLILNTQLGCIFISEKRNGVGSEATLYQDSEPSPKSESEDQYI